MFRFENPEYLYLFIAMPFLVALYIYLNIRKRNDVKRLGVLSTVKRMMPELSLKRSYLKFWLIFAALCAGIFMIARPQFGTKVETVEKEGIELVIAIDVSNSMLARDVTPDRLSRAKQILSRIIDVRKNDKVALIVLQVRRMCRCADLRYAVGQAVSQHHRPGPCSCSGTAIAEGNTVRDELLFGRPDVDRR